MAWLARSIAIALAGALGMRGASALAHAARDSSGTVSITVKRR